MTTFCHMCGTQAIDDKSLFCTICGTKLIQSTPENINGKCPHCGTQILDQDSVFCLQCGSPVSTKYSEVPHGSPGTGVTTYAQESLRLKEGTTLPAMGTVRSYKYETEKSKSQKPLKRISMVLPVILFIIAFVLLLWMVSQPGVVDPISSIGSITASQEHKLVPANGTTPTPLLTTVIPTTQAAMKNPTVTSTPVSTVTTGAPMTQAAMKNIIETAETDGRFTTLITAMKAAELDSMLSDADTSFTVFAPTDDAFKNLTGTIDPLLKDPQGDLLQILLYHVVNGKVMAADLGKLTSAETLQGGSLQISVSDGIITVDGATVIITDIECSNGVIHVVDTVMLPPA